MKTARLAAGLAALCSLGLHAQNATAPAPIVFEAASVKPNTDGPGESYIRRQPGGRLNAVNMPLRALLAERFNLKVRRETREMDIYAMVGPEAPMCGIRQNFGRTGPYDFVMTFAPEPPRGPLPPGVELPPVDPNAPSLFTALQEQLGLRLDATRGPVEVLVVEAIARPVSD